MYSILQISDLHRSLDDPIDNDTLLSALLADRDRYTLELPSPSSIIVSGDIVRGVKIGHNNWQQEMKSQYEIAADFLGRLCDEFLDGDRSQIAIIPGNHDVCWNTSANSFEKVPKKEHPSRIQQELSNPNSQYRWSWNELELYRIKDEENYENRLSEYWTFLEDFYYETELQLPIDRNRGYHFFELIDKRVFLAGFESTFGNDSFRYSGALATGVVGRCAMDMRKIQRSYDLKVATWHHSVYGPPDRDDYLDVNFVREMAGHGFQIGLHGHQHVAESGLETISLNGGHSMAVISAGSLCAGWNELPRGVNRQYNVVSLKSCLTTGSLHVREMIEGNQFSRKANGAFLEGSVQLNWSRQLNAVGKPINIEHDNIRGLTEAVEKSLQDKEKSPLTNNLLLAKPSAGTYEMKILVEALVFEQRWQEIKDILTEPSSIEEFVAAIKAAIELNDITTAQTILDRSDIPEALAEGLQTIIDLKKELGTIS